MEYKTLILADTSAAALERIDDLRELCRVYAGYFNEAVGLAVLETKDLEIIGAMDGRTYQIGTRLACAEFDAGSGDHQ